MLPRDGTREDKNLLQTPLTPMLLCRLWNVPFHLFDAICSEDFLMHLGEECAKWYYIQIHFSHTIATLSARPLKNSETFFSGYLWHWEEGFLQLCSSRLGIVMETQSWVLTEENCSYQILRVT